MIAVPIVAPDVRSALADMKAAVVAGADIAELRLDYLPALSETDLRRLLEFKGIKKIATLRRNKDGGRFSGSESERLRALSLACRLGADYVDLELGCDVSRVELCSAKLIVSWHDFSGTPTADELVGVYQVCAALGAHVVKVVTMANEYNDNIRIFGFLERVLDVSDKGSGVPVVSFCMGEKGELSRIFSRKFGSLMTFAALSSGKESASGQLEISSVKGWDEVIL